MSRENTPFLGSPLVADSELLDELAGGLDEQLAEAPSAEELTRLLDELAGGLDELLAEALTSEQLHALLAELLAGEPEP